jgi:hypothetical protein
MTIITGGKMKFKVGDLIVHKPAGIERFGAVEAIILEHWQTETLSPLRIAKDGIIDNVRLFITFDEDDPTAVGDIDVMCGFREQHWSLKNEI